MPAVWGGGRVRASRLRVPRPPALTDPPTLRGRVRRSGRARDSSIQIQGLAAPSESARASARRATRGRRPGRVGGCRGPASSGEGAEQGLQPIRPPCARAEGLYGAGRTARPARPYEAHTAPGWPRPPVAPEQRSRRVCVARSRSWRQIDPGSRRRRHDRRHARCVRRSPQSGGIWARNRGRSGARNRIKVMGPTFIVGRRPVSTSGRLTNGSSDPRDQYR